MQQGGDAPPAGRFHQLSGRLGEHSPGGRVDEGRHPRLDPPPAAAVGVAEPAHPAVAVLVDTQVLYVQGVDVGQRVDRVVHRLLGGPPRHLMGLGDLGDRLTLVDDRGQQRLTQARRAPSPSRQLARGLGERPSRAPLLGAHQPWLHHQHLHTAGVRDVLDPLPTPRMHPRRHHPAVGAAAGDGVGLHDHPPTTQGQVDRVDHVVVRQVKDHARSVTLRAHRLDHSSWSLSGWMLRNTHPSARPRALASTTHHAQLRVAGKPSKSSPWGRCGAWPR